MLFHGGITMSIPAIGPYPERSESLNSLTIYLSNIHLNDYLSIYIYVSQRSSSFVVLRSEF
jgi:hypothetical protein